MLIIGELERLYKEVCNDLTDLKGKVEFNIEFIIFEIPYELLEILNIKCINRE